MTQTKQDADTQAIIAGCSVLILMVTLFPLFILLGWNVGVVAAVAACGGHVSTISFWAAIGLSFAIGILKGIIRAGRGK